MLFKNKVEKFLVDLYKNSVHLTLSTDGSLEKSHYAEFYTQRKPPKHSKKRQILSQTYF